MEEEVGEKEDEGSDDGDAHIVARDWLSCVMLVIKDE